MSGKTSKAIKIYTERESFFDKLSADFYISSYKDEEPEVLNRIDAHRHTYYEIIWLRLGKGTHTIDFTDYEFTGPCLFLLHPQNIHTIQKETPTEGGVVKFSASAIQAEEGKTDFMLRYGVFDDIDVLPVIPLTASQCGELQEIFNQLYKEYNHQSVLSGEIMLSYLTIFLLKIYAIKKSRLPAEQLKSSDLLRFRRFQQLLSVNFKIRHNASFYAERLSLTVKTLGNLTRHCSGMAPSLLIKQRILLEAKRLLHHSDLSVKEIAWELGFDDSSYFIRFFKQNTQLSPNEYKKANLKR